MPVTELREEFGMRFADFSNVMTDHPETTAAQKDTEQLTKLLDLELAQKRITWKQTSERARSIRATGLVFLFLLIVACLLGGYFAFMRVNEQRGKPPPASTIDR